MAYCTIADVERRVGGADKLVQLADQDGNGASDAGLVDAAIAEADALIDTYASKRFSVPFAPVPPTIAALSARIAARVLRRWRQMQLVADESEEKADIGWLEHLAKGLVLPGVEPIPDKGDIVTDNAGPREPTKNVSREKLKGFW